MLSVVLHRIECVKTSDEILRDELYLRVDTTRVWPTARRYHRFDDGEQLEVDREIFDGEPGDRALITLLEYDPGPRRFHERLGQIVVAATGEGLAIDERHDTTYYGRRRNHHVVAFHAHKSFYRLFFTARRYDVV